MIDPALAKQYAYNTEAHARLSRSLTDRLRLSYDTMSNRYAQLAANEEQFQAYIKETDADAVRRTRRDNAGIPSYRTIEIPYTYAILMTAHTYYTSVFLARQPIFQFVGRHGEAQMNEQAVEALMDYQVNAGGLIVPYYNWLLDPGKYGFGVVGHYWDKKTVRRRRKVQQQVTFMGQPVAGKFEVVDEVEDVVAYEGNRTYNVRPQDFFPDPRVAMRNFQNGEFCARYVEIPWHEIVQGAADEKYFNVEHLRKSQRSDTVDSGGVIPRDVGSSAVTTLPGEHDSLTYHALERDLPAAFVKGHEIYVRLSPRMWRLGESSRQEVWVFHVSTNGIIFGINPLEDATDAYPFDIMEAEVEGYSLFSRSMVERVKPLNDVITWLLNSHFFNVRATLNNQFVFDPSMIVQQDVENPNPGKAIRIKPAGYGRDIRSMLMQLNVSDITRNHVSDARTLEEIIQRVLGVNDNIMGMLDPGGRKTATEVRTSSSFGVNRLKTQCEYFSAMGFQPHAQKLLQRTQLMYSAEKKFRIVGDIAQFGRGFVDITPDSIAGFYDFVPVDGTLPVDRYAQANLWQQLLQGIVQIPQIAMTYDIAKIFAWVGQLAGIKNMQQFRLQVVPDQQLSQQAQAGNVVPLRDVTRVPEPNQIPGMGATG